MQMMENEEMTDSQTCVCVSNAGWMNNEVEVLNVC